MAVSNPATFSSIKAEFGGSNNFKDYYRGGPYVPTNAPAQISTTANGLAMSQFNGVSKPPTMTQTLGASAVSHTTNPKTMATNYSGTATSTPSGGTAPYTYSWSRVSGVAATLTNTTTATVSWTWNDGGAGAGGTLTLQCVCNDSAGHSVTTQITISF